MIETFHNRIKVFLVRWDLWAPSLCLERRWCQQLSEKLKTLLWSSPETDLHPSFGQQHCLFPIFFKSPHLPPRRLSFLQLSSFLLLESCSFPFLSLLCWDSLFPFVRLYFPHRAHSWLSLGLLAQEYRWDEFGGILRWNPRSHALKAHAILPIHITSPNKIVLSQSMQ